MTAVLLVALYALAPPLLLWRYYRLAGHGAGWDVALALNVAVNAGAAGIYAWDEWRAIEPGQVAYAVRDWAGWAAVGLTFLSAAVLAVKPWPRTVPAKPAPRRRKAGAARREPVVSAGDKGGAA